MFILFLELTSIIQDVFDNDDGNSDDKENVWLAIAGVACVCLWTFLGIGLAGTCHTSKVGRCRDGTQISLGGTGMDF